MRWTPILIAVLVGAIGCPSGPQRYDTDGDGTEDQADCAPTDPSIYPGASDLYGDGIDRDCDGVDGIDTDGDDYPANPELIGQPFYDCNDSNPSINPAADEVVGDGLDNDCDGFEAEDADGDGFLDGVDDCDDADGSVHDGALEQPDGVDDDCDGEVDEGTVGTDDDGDGFCEGHEYEAGVPSCADNAVPGDCDDGDPAFHPADDDGDGVSPCGPDGIADSSDDDCDDDDATVHPGAVEVCNGRDDDCTDGIPAAEFDGDGDGITGCAGDCADADAAVFPGAVESCNVADDDCDGSIDEGFDADGDGFTPCGPTPDCDDLDNAINPGAAEVCDLVDNDCDGVQPDEQDDDGDGDPACSDCDDDDPLFEDLDTDGDGASTCGDDGQPGTVDDDCDDGDATVHPTALDAVDAFGLDANCDGVDGVDADGDGSPSVDSGGPDCDDADVSIHGLDSDGDGWTLCGPDLVLGTGDEDCDDDDPALDLDDADGDGWSGCTGDCDDSDGTVYPNAELLCDGKDNDCDGWADVAGDLSDFDGDGFFACEDCEDGEATIYPGAAELCDGLDGDCDGVVPANGPAGEFDNDGDGYAECAGDCNDFLDTMNPGEVDSCDGIDTDCDGVVDSDPDVDGDGWCAGDCDDLDPSLHPGQWEDPHDGIDLDCSGTDATHLEHLGAQLLGGEAGEAVGIVAWIPDFTGDGNPEMAVGAPHADVNALDSAGKVYIVTSEQLAGLPSFSLADAHAVLRGDTSYGYFGRSVLGLEDLDGDGLGDLVVGEHTWDPDLYYFGGAVHVFVSSVLATGGVIARSEATVVVAPAAAYDHLGESLAPMGDIDGDGLSDFAVGARENSGAYSDAGSVYVLTSDDLTSSGGTFDVESAFAIIRGGTFGGEFGASLAGGFDFEQDGVADLVVGAPEIEDPAEGKGMIYGFLGGQLQDGGVFTDADAWFTISPAWNSNLGAVSAAGDVEGDGAIDLALRIPWFDRYSSGQSAGGLLVFTSAQLVAGGDLDEADRWARFDGDQGGDGQFGTTMVGADLDGDGDVELAIGDPAAADGTPDLGVYGAGKVWIYDGSTIGSGGVFTTSFAAAGLEGFGHWHQVGNRPLSVADVDGDGSLELIVTAAGDDEGGANAGKVYVLSPEL